MTKRLEVTTGGQKEKKKEGRKRDKGMEKERGKIQTKEVNKEK